MTDHDAGTAIEALQHTVDALLDPPGCEWNRAQTHASLVTYLLEESYELVEAIEAGSADDLREELGDVLYQVVLHAGIAQRAGEGFGLAEVVEDVDAKIRRRHPHVFGADTAADVDDIVRLWSAAKAVEKAGRESAFDGVPLGLPALSRVQKIAGRAGEARGAGTRRGTFAADTELDWGRHLLAEVDEASARGWDAERALREALRERERALRAREKSLRTREKSLRTREKSLRGEEEWRGAPQPE
ncbi:XTP/dITP diphosphohydrolase [Frondihabitans sp. PhB188]|uniref:MazG nucleotide pyrophosphohydrolase domain-containing protein n=1 Tax=Frondihabitans sp. PhB188 TaxID=2485200 RepID=UPI000F466F01|nr:MazG nucleotide pyrophosphohydrolase domain-containing protein [Frondihabitans sp. PhB188]ROQ38541.1 XTP/dITP diphosphohydrolase [Frondihabitans sp. PhB188]